MSQEKSPLVDAFLAGMSTVSASVCIATTAGAAGRAGVTITAFTSVSADDPAVLICIHHLSPAAGTFIRNGVFCVNVLRSSQSYVADAFAGRLRDRYADKFDCGTWRTMATGAPALAGALAVFDCTVANHIRWNTHEVFFGSVRAVESDQGKSLIYANRGYAAAMNTGEVDELVPWLTLQGW